MSELSYLEKLMDGVEVEWKTLEDITLRTSNIKWREAIRSYRYIDLTSVDIATKKIIETTEITKNNAPSRAQKLVDENDVIFATTRPTQQRFCLIDSEYAGAVASTGYCILRAKKDQVLPKWILHWISTSDFKKHVEENQSGSAYPAISDSKVKECLIPIPCPDNPEKSLAIQSEIVRILDKFTALTAELTAELNMRKKQYNYYRDQLLSFDEEQEKPIYLEKLLDGVEVEWLPLSDLARIRNGKDHKSLSEGEFPVYGSGGIMRYVDTYAYNKPSVLIPRKGSLGNLFFIDVPFWTVDTIFYTEIDEAQIRPKYLYYFLSTVGLGEMNQAGGVPSQTQSVLNKLKIPIPCPDNPEKSLAIQSEIVRILDKFDTLTNSITEGLPREIELRQKQYEYYRDLLFSFPKPETASN
ncbi:restriction endonuclease subunit S [Escherichia coli]|uniref:Restriction endonuclease n=4 Tax=Escherichia TaxID=561 RepID=A0A1M0QJP2_ECOLX|nr:MULTISPECIES: restriction endonuclease subunit S [Enterobacteriaceae]HAI1307321.1 restriction endonuclease subunit S [Escherichia fergusonii]HAV0862231.1 restriction endonuclease subunit S [Salmonella enterica subsp. enterica serovar Indiana]AKP86006.1 type I restriction modification system specificity protein [Escherichia coli ACN001]AUZ15424.1 restriction endonuclease [Escherichia coli]EFN3690786.1 restriction endonuclease subunit S [Escherichia coli]